MWESRYIFTFKALKQINGDSYIILHIKEFTPFSQAHFFYFLDFKKTISNNLLINYYFRRVP